MDNPNNARDLAASQQRRFRILIDALNQIDRERRKDFKAEYFSSHGVKAKEECLDRWEDSLKQAA